MSANPALVINPSLYRNLPYNAERDFTPVTRGVVALVPVFDTPDQFGTTLKSECERWAAFIRRNNIQPDQ